MVTETRCTIKPNFNIIIIRSFGLTVHPIIEEKITKKLIAIGSRVQTLYQFENRAKRKTFKAIIVLNGCARVAFCVQCINHIGILNDISSNINDIWAASENCLPTHHKYYSDCLLTFHLSLTFDPCWPYLCVNVIHKVIAWVEHSYMTGCLVPVRQPHSYNIYLYNI